MGCAKCAKRRKELMAAAAAGKFRKATAVAMTGAKEIIAGHRYHPPATPVHDDKDTDV